MRTFLAIEISLFHIPITVSLNQWRVNKASFSYLNHSLQCAYSET